MREVQNKLKEFVNRIEFAKDLIKDQVDKIDFDKAITLLQEATSSLEEVKSMVEKEVINCQENQI